MATQNELHLLIESTDLFWERFVSFVGLFQKSATSLTVVLQPNEVIYEAKRSGNEHVNSDELAKVLQRLEVLPWALIQHVKFHTVVVGNESKGLLTFRFDLSSGYTMPVQWSANQQVTSEVLWSLSQAFTIATEQEALAIRLPEVAGDRIVAYQDAIVSLKDTASNLAKTQAQAIAENSQFIRRVTEEFTGRIVEQENSLLERKRAQDDAIAAERLELGKERAELDLRESRKVRRDLLEKMEALVEKQESFIRSIETQRSDKRVMWFCSVLILVGFLLASAAIGLLAAGRVEHALFYPPFVAGSLLLASNALVLVWHLVKTSRRHADADFAIMQYSRDMYRMSWIAELMFEAQTNLVGDEVQKVDIPEPLLDSFARSLFTDARDGAGAHPLEELQQYAKRFKKFSVSARGCSATIGSPL